MKKIKYILGGMLLALLLASGCASFRTAEQTEDAITVLARDHSSVEEIFTKKFPDIKFKFIYYDGKSPTAALRLKEKHHDITDIYMGTLPMDAQNAKENLIDLSGYEFCDKFEPSILGQYDVDGSIYQIPSSINIRCIVYNREMFEEHGWKEPQTFGELTALCRQIRAETDGITPIVFGGAAQGYYFTMMTTYAQTQFLYTPEGVNWQKEYLAGNAKAEDGFGSGIQMTQELIDAGAFDYDKNDGLWDTELFKERMAAGEAAMEFVWGGQNNISPFLSKNKEKYKMIPFRNYEGDAFLGTSTNYCTGLSKKLEEPGNEKKLKDALRVMEWLATEEAQNKLSITPECVIYPLKNVTNKQALPQFREVWNDNLDGIKAPMMYAGYEDILVQAAEYIAEAVRGEHDLSGLADLIDEIHQASVEGDRDNEEAYVGTFAKDFTHEETVQMMAEIMHARKDSEITLVSDGQRIGKVKNFAGVHSKFYEGALNYDEISASLPGNPVMDGEMLQFTLTGAQIQKLLENGKHMITEEDQGNERAVEKDENALYSSDYDYYWAGMKAELKEGKVISMELDNGTPIEKDKTYTVSFAEGDYMDTTEAAGNPVKLGYTIEEVFIEYMRDNSPVSPVKVRRFRK